MIRSSPFSRRRFIQQLLGAGALSLTGLDFLRAQGALATPTPAQAFRFAFLTDFHLMIDDTITRSAEGIATCLAAVEKLSPRPEFILVGGDLVHRSREYSIADGEKTLEMFLKIWNDHTSLPAHWTFGNHDFVGTSNPTVSTSDKHYGKGLFRDRFQLPNLFYSYDFKGWHFVILDDVALQADRSYLGELFDDELLFLRADLDAHRDVPTIVCAHIPLVTDMGPTFALAAALGHPHAHNFVCDNADRFFADLPGHNIRAVLCGHLHHLEKLNRYGIPFVNSGAVCGDYWKGPRLGTPEGFGVVDLGTDGSVAFDYRDYGWKA